MFREKPNSRRIPWASLRSAPTCKSAPAPPLLRRDQFVGWADPGLFREKLDRPGTLTFRGAQPIRWMHRQRRCTAWISSLPEPVRWADPGFNRGSPTCGVDSIASGVAALRPTCALDAQVTALHAGYSRLLCSLNGDTNSPPTTPGAASTIPDASIPSKRTAFWSVARPLDRLGYSKVNWTFSLGAAY